MKRLKPTLRKTEKKDSVVMTGIDPEVLTEIILPKLLSWIADSGRRLDLENEGKISKAKSPEIYFTVESLELPNLKAKDLVACLKSLSFDAREVEVPHPDTGLVGKYIYLNMEKTYKSSEKRIKDLKNRGQWDPTPKTNLTDDILTEKQWNNIILPKTQQWERQYRALHKEFVVFDVGFFGIEGLQRGEVLRGLKDRGYTVSEADDVGPRFVNLTTSLSNFLEQSLKSETPEGKLKTSHLFK